jgi:fluoride ion exporter CrcB/FEX
MLQDGEWKRGAAYIVLSVAGGLAAVLVGMRLGDVL